MFLNARSMAGFMNTPGGAVYGFAPLPFERSIWAGLPRTPKTPLPGVYLASSFGQSGGFSGAMRAGADAVIYSDFRHGIFNRRTIPDFICAMPERVYRVADSQVASRWGNITEFKGFDLITPNEREARFALADQDLGIRPLASNLYDAAHLHLRRLRDRRR